MPRSDVTDQYRSVLASLWPLASVCVSGISDPDNPEKTK